MLKWISLLWSHLDTIHTQPLNGPLSSTIQVGWYQKKHSPTHIHPDHQTSFINFLHLLRSIASSVFSLHAWQSFFTTSPGPLWSSSWSGTLYFILHTFLDPIIISFLQHMPIPSMLCHLFLNSLSAPYLEICILKLNDTHPPDHSHLC